jgi:hypothetical protein
MNQGQSVFAQLMRVVSHDEFRRCVQRYNGNRGVRSMSCWDQFLAMAFAQLTYRESLRDIEVCLGAQGRKLYQAGFRCAVKRSTLADANEQRDWRIYADLAQSLIAVARPLYADTDLGIDLDATIYALDSTTIDLCLAMFPWAHFRRAKGAVKLHTLLDLKGAIPVFIHVSHGKTHDVTALDVLTIDPGAYVILDRGYLDFQRLYRLHQGLSFFVIRAKSNIQCRRRYSHPVEAATGVRSDQTIRLTGPKTATLYPDRLRRISYYAADIDKRFVFLTNNFLIPASTVAALYRYRWQVELFFKWIKQHLRINRFYGTSLNSVKTQVWIAVAVYVLVAIIKKRLGLPHPLYTILQVLSLTLFEKTPISSMFSRLDDALLLGPSPNQLNLFEN